MLCNKLLHPFIIPLKLDVFIFYFIYRWPDDNIWAPQVYEVDISDTNATQQVIQRYHYE